MSDLSKEVQDAINKHLSAEVGSVLRARLEQAEKDAAEVARLRQVVIDGRQANLALDERVAQLTNELKQHEGLATRELNVSRREIALELEIQKGKTANAEKSQQDLLNLVGTIFRSPVVTESVMGNNTRIDSNGCSHCEPYNETRTRSQS